MTEFLQAYPVALAAWVGLTTAAAVDIVAFRSWKSADEAYQYDWKLAVWRWGQGVVYGALSGLGLTGLASGL